MSDVRQSTTTGAGRAPVRREAPPPTPTAWAGWVVFGGMMMIALGAFQAMAGIVALLNDTYYAVVSSRLVVSVDYTVWGWTHLAFGALALVAGVGLMTGAMWARVLGVAVAALSMVLNFAFIPAAPLWALTIITLDVLVIYAIMAHGSEVKNYQG